MTAGTPQPFQLAYLDAVWKNRIGSTLFVNLDPASVARITQQFTDDGDFNSLMSALADVLGQVVQPGRPSRRNEERSKRCAFIVPALESDPAERVKDARSAKVGG